MYQTWDSLRGLLDPELLLREGGIYLLLFIIFAETGLFFGFFLPGDYLLFLAGIFTATDKLNAPLYVVILGLILAAILGNFTGYWFGKKAGPLLYHRPDTILFKKKYLRAAEEYYKKQGAFTLILGRFIPIVRTFAPILAGVIGLNFQKFIFYNVAGAIIWVSSLTLSGFFLGKKFEKEINDYLLYIVIGFITVTALPLVISYLKSRLGKKKVNKP